MQTSPWVKGVLALCALLVFNGCASGPPFERAGVSPNTAVIYVYRKPSLVGANTEYRLFANNQYVTNIVNGGYYSYVANPGPVNFAFVYGANPIMLGNYLLIYRWIENYGRSERLSVFFGRCRASPGRDRNSRRTSLWRGNAYERRVIRILADVMRFPRTDDARVYREFSRG
jgi:hypothetical protein